MSLFSDPRWGEALAHLPDYLGNHVRVSVTALALGLLVSLPLAIAARNRPLMRALLLGLASIVQTVPGLALLALSIRCYWRWPRYRFPGSASAFPRSDFCPPCSRSRFIRCCRFCETPSRASRASSLRSSRPRKASA